MAKQPWSVSNRRKEAGWGIGSKEDSLCLSSSLSPSVAMPLASVPRQRDLAGTEGALAWVWIPFVPKLGCIKASQRKGPPCSQSPPVSFQRKVVKPPRTLRGGGRMHLCRL